MIAALGTTVALIWDNERGRKKESIHIDSKIGEMKIELKGKL